MSRAADLHTRIALWREKLGDHRFGKPIARWLSYFDDLPQNVSVKVAKLLRLIETRYPGLDDRINGLRVFFGVSPMDDQIFSEQQKEEDGPTGLDADEVEPTKLGVDPEPPSKGDVVDLDEVLAVQREMFRVAREFMNSRKGRKGVLIFIGMQHPLELDEKGKRTKPGVELEARVDKTVEIRNHLKEMGFDVQIFGDADRHQHNGVWDDISLGEATHAGLKERGIPDDEIISHEAVLGLMQQCGLDAIGNGQDETKVVATLFKSDDRFAYLYSIGGPAQLGRMLQGFLNEGVLAIGATPQMYRDGSPVPPDKLHHRIDYEAIAIARLAARNIGVDRVAAGYLDDAVLRHSRTVPADGLVLNSESLAS